MNTNQQLQTNGEEGDNDKNMEEEEEEEAKEKEKLIKDENELGQDKESLEGGGGLSPSSSSASTAPSSSDVTAQNNDIDSSGKELKPATPRPFKLNPDAQEFKPFTPPVRERERK